MYRVPGTFCTRSAVCSPVRGVPNTMGWLAWALPRAATTAAAAAAAAAH